MSDLKVYSYAIVFQEVPNEVSLAINISGCPHHCEGCHSPELAEDIGNDLFDELPKLLETYNKFITCVCFMGGDQNMKKLKQAIKFVKRHGLKTAVYSGLDIVSPFTNEFTNTGDPMDIGTYIDYLKIGHYDENLGGLSSPTTNQRMYFFLNNSIKDITSWFQRKRQ